MYVVSVFRLLCSTVQEYNEINQTKLMTLKPKTHVKLLNQTLFAIKISFRYLQQLFYVVAF